MDDAARDKVIAALKSVVGAGVTVGALSDKTAAAVAVANDRATTELASLPVRLRRQGPPLRAQ